MAEAMQPATDAAKSIEAGLVEAGWTVASNWGELVDPNGIVWFGLGFVSGEITVTASYRPRGAGPAEGAVRVRITPTFAKRHPEVPGQLVGDLIWISAALEDEGRDVAAFLHRDDVWPPAHWREYAR